MRRAGPGPSPDESALTSPAWRRCCPGKDSDSSVLESGKEVPNVEGRVHRRARGRVRTRSVRPAARTRSVTPSGSPATELSAVPARPAGAALDRGRGRPALGALQAQRLIDAIALRAAPAAVAGLVAWLHLDGDGKGALVALSVLASAQLIERSRFPLTLLRRGGSRCWPRRRCSALPARSRLPSPLAGRWRPPGWPAGRRRLAGARHRRLSQGPGRAGRPGPGGRGREPGADRRPAVST
jgi:hypothetical protein